MEVHAHTHTARKKWTHYFWEFLMLFLAVFCGFLAENFREHKVEEKRVKDLLRSMIQNLTYDTTRLYNNTLANETLIPRIDSIRTEIKAILEGKKNYSMLYSLVLKGLPWSYPSLTTTAISQLKNSGLLRLIKPDSLNFAIVDYYERKSGGMAGSIEALNDFTKALNEERNGIFDFTPFHEYISLRKNEFASNLNAIRKRLNESWFPEINEKNYNLQLANSSRPALIKLYNDYSALENQFKNYYSRMRYVKEEAVILIEQIKQAYHFK